MAKYANLAGTKIPDRLLMELPGLTADQGRMLSTQALIYARRESPKLSGNAAFRLLGLYGPGYFGIRWRDDYVWFQEAGTKPHTMRKLAGKTIPMWIDDPRGEERECNPKAKTRITASGKTQVLIFRKAAPIGSRKTITRRAQGRNIDVSVPRSYPGAPGRIANREAGAPRTAPGKRGGAVVRFNTGVRWRHPGLPSRNFLYYSMVWATQDHGIHPLQIYAVNGPR